MDVLGKKVKAAKNATRAELIRGIRMAGPRLPFMKKAGALNEKSRTGMSREEAILMEWHKPSDWYPHYLYRPSKRGGRGEQIAFFPHKIYDNGFGAGVDFWPTEGMKLLYRGGDEPRGGGVKKFTRELQEEGIELDSDLPYETDIDHVIDWAFGGDDNALNLWPLHRGTNRSAGTTQNRTQYVWWAQDKASAPQRTPIEQVPHGRWFEIKTIKDPGDKKG